MMSLFLDGIPKDLSVFQFRVSFLCVVVVVVVVFVVVVVSLTFLKTFV